MRLSNASLRFVAYYEESYHFRCDVYTDTVFELPSTKHQRVLEFSLNSVSLYSLKSLIRNGRILIFVPKSFDFVSIVINPYIMVYDLFNLLGYTWKTLLSLVALISIICVYFVLPSLSLFIFICQKFSFKLFILTDNSVWVFRMCDHWKQGIVCLTAL